MRVVASVVVLLTVAGRDALPQQVLNWPLHTSAAPEAVLRGAEANFWNPAGVRSSNGRGEILMASQRTPAAVGLAGLAAAASWNILPRLTIAAAYQHVSVDDIAVTSTSPMPDAGGGSVVFSQDQVRAALSRELVDGVQLGAGAGLARSSRAGLTETDAALNAGLLLRSSLPLQPELGAAITKTGDERAGYAVGLQLLVPLTPMLLLSPGYGRHGGARELVVEHRIGMTASWRDQIAVTAGAATARTAGNRTWTPLLGASLHVARYQLGIVRELLANDFGAAYSLGFRIGLK